MCLMFWKKKPEKDQALLAASRHGEDKISLTKTETFVVEEIEPIIVKTVKKAKIQKYHVSQNKDRDADFYMKWRVRKENSDKTIQYFDTQKIAIDYAQDLATKIGSTIVIHKLDGSIRKQDYTTKP